MISESILARLKDLKYQGKLKKYNIAITSKNNNFGDVVKFFAQINVNDVVQKISFKASGCTAFIAVCSYFCEMVEGKTVANALKIGQDKINTIVNLDSSREHVFPIVISTFAQLVKKYRKGLDAKTIMPCEVDDLSESNSRKIASSKKAKLHDSIEKDDKNIHSKSIKKSSIEDTSTSQEVKIEEKTIKKSNNSISDKKVKTPNTKESKKKDKSINQSEVVIISDNSNINNVSKDVATTAEEKPNYTISDISESLFQDEIKDVHNTHLANLQHMVNSKEDGNVVVESNVEHTHNLSYLLQKYTDDKNASHKATITKTTKTTKTISVSSNNANNTPNVQSALDSLDDLRKVNEEKNVARDTKEILSEEPKKKKKSFFDIFRKKSN